MRKHAITWGNIDPHLCHLMASLGHNELMDQTYDFYGYAIQQFYIWKKKEKNPQRLPLNLAFWSCAWYHMTSQSLSAKPFTQQDIYDKCQTWHLPCTRGTKCHEVQDNNKAILDLKDRWKKTEKGHMKGHIKMHMYFLWFLDAKKGQVSHPSLLKTRGRRRCSILTKPIKWLPIRDDRPITQILQCTSPISHNAPLCNRNVHMHAHFCFKIMHCGIFVLQCGICEMQNQNCL